MDETNYSETSTGHSVICSQQDPIGINHAAITSPQRFNQQLKEKNRWYGHRSGRYYHHHHTHHRFHFARKKKFFCCVNCGKEGHVYKQCQEPITSFGIIALRKFSGQCADEIDRDQTSKERYLCEKHKSNAIYVSSNKFLQNDREKKPLEQMRYLMVQRKDTIGFIDFIRGKYPDDIEQRESTLRTYLSEMTCEERLKLSQETFEDLWDFLWINKLSMLYINEYVEAKRKFDQLDVQTLLETTECHWTEQEYGFPKGRKNMYESNIECAKREFKEESGYTPDQIEIISDKPWEEVFTGTNGVKYKHVYYIAKILPGVTEARLPLEDVKMAGEISNMGWFTYEECVQLIRPYDQAKKDLIAAIHSKYGQC